MMHAKLEVAAGDWLYFYCASVLVSYATSYDGLIGRPYLSLVPKAPIGTQVLLYHSHNRVGITALSHRSTGLKSISTVRRFNDSNDAHSKS